VVGATTVVFLLAGGVAVALLALSLLAGDLLPGHVHVPTDLDVVSLPVIAGFLGAVGFGGAIAAELTPGSGGADVLAALVAGLAAAVPTAWLVARLVRAARAMPTDATIRRADLVGALGVVVSAVPVDGYGQVRLQVGGAPMKVNAKSAGPLPAGTPVFVVDAPTETSVVVEASSSFLPSIPPPEQKDR
jgi:membrane protein implicated in regulation of membrane protease activity